jgi:hypothetical protein
MLIFHLPLQHANAPPGSNPSKCWHSFETWPLARYANELTKEGGDSYVPVNILQGSYIVITSQHSDWRSSKDVQELLFWATMS